MPFIPRQVKAPPRFALTCKVPETVATMLKLYAEFLDSPQEYVVTQTLRLAFRRDKEFHAWLAATHPETPMPATESLPAPGELSGRTQASPAASPPAATARRVPPASAAHAPRTDHEPLAREDRTRP